MKAQHQKDANNALMAQTEEMEQVQEEERRTRSSDIDYGQAFFRYITMQQLHVILVCVPNHEPPPRSRFFF